LFHPSTPAVNMLNLVLVTIFQTVFENTLMQHHVALPPGSMGKISYIAPAGQYSLQVSRYCHIMERPTASLLHFLFILLEFT
jgi:vacuolar-type H+-ATPase catalytic subunit A/Vma1